MARVRLRGVACSNASSARSPRSELDTRQPTIRRENTSETVIGSVKTEEIYRRGPWKGLEDVEPLGSVPPAEFEQAYYERQAAPDAAAVLT